MSTSQEPKSAAERSFRIARTPGRAAAGIAAAVAIVSFTFLVFGPLSDQRVLALGGVHEADDAGDTGVHAPATWARPPMRSASNPARRDRVARVASTGITARLAFGMALPP